MSLGVIILNAKTNEIEFSNNFINCLFNSGKTI